MKSLFRLSLAALVTLWIVGCSASSRNGNQHTPPMATDIKAVSISQSSTIPAYMQPGQEFYLVVRNNSKDDLSLVTANSTSIIDQAEHKSGFYNKLFQARAASVIGVNTSGCQRLRKGSTCSLLVTPQASSGRAEILLTFKSDSDKIYQATQLIRVGNVISTSNFLVNDENLNVVAPKETLFDIAIPFVLTTNFEPNSVKIVSSITPLGTQILCAGNSVSKNNSCTAILTYKASNFVSNLKLTGVVLSNGETASTNLVTVVNTSVIPNLISNGNNVVITTGNGSSIVNVLNTGLATANASVGSSDPANITVTSDCATLAAGASCTLSLSSNATVNGSGTVTISYDGGRTLLMNVIYLAANQAPGMSFITSGSLSNVVTGESKIFALQLINNSTTPTTMQAINFTNPGDQNSHMQFSNMVGDPVCATNGSQLLKQGESCNIGISFAPTAGNQNGSFNFIARALYLESAGTTVSYSIFTPVNFSSVAAAHISITPIESALSILANKIATASTTYVAINDGGYVASSFSGELQLPTPSPANLLIESSSTCLGKAMLQVQESCTYIVNYGPESANESGVAILRATYQPYPGTVTTIATADLDYKSSVAVLIKTTGPTLFSAATGGTGDPASGIDPYTFSPTTNNVVQVKYVYTNQGSDTATNFNVNINELPFGYYMLASSTCNSGGMPIALTVGASCNLILGYPDPSYLAPFYSSLLGVHNLTPLGYSYSDTSTGVNTGVTDSGAYITADSWGQVTTNNINITTTYSLTFTLNSIDSSVANFPVTISVSLDSIFTGTHSCEITSLSSGTCIISGNVDSAAPAGAYTYPWRATPSGSAATVPASGYVTLTK